jgi:hypothetical protein
VLGDPVDLVDPTGEIGLDDIKYAIYNNEVAKQCSAMLKNYDCGCMTGIECAMAKEQLRQNCESLQRKEFVKRLSPGWINDK